MQKYCSQCGSLDIRLSRFRASDVVRLLALQWPIRCMDCLMRGHAFVFMLPGRRKRREKTV
jgi:hypothetical protein